MNLFEKLLSLKYVGMSMPFIINISEPVKADTIFNDNNYRANGSWYWRGDLFPYTSTAKNKQIKGIIGHDCRLYIRVRYNGNFGKKIKEEFHTMQSNISKEEIDFITKDSAKTNYAKYSINIDNILLKADTFIIDKTTERHGKRLIKNFIHFSSKDLTGKDYEGYLIFSDNAVDSIFKKYLLELYSTNQVKS